MELRGVIPVITAVPYVLLYVRSRSSHPSLNLRFTGCRRIFNRPFQSGPCVQATGLNDHAASRLPD
jgi:hypothetical protein